MSKVAPFAEKAGEAEDTTPAWQLKVVSLLNPKLKNYTNPFRLAAAIIVTSVIIFALVLTSYLVDCPVIKGGPMTMAPMAEIKGMVQKGMIDCLQQVMTFRTDTDWGMVKHCDPGNWVKDNGLTWCESHISIGAPGSPPAGEVVDKSMHDHFKGITKPAGCKTSEDEVDKQGDVFAFYYDQKVCRDGSTAFALALSYTVYIEMVSTVLIIILFQRMKCSQPKDKSKSIMAVADNEDNKDFGSELVSRSEVKKMISEYMAAMEMSPKLLGNKQNDWTPEPEAKSG